MKDLSKNNDRAWFEKNKGKYLEAKDQFDQFVSKLLHDLTDFDQSLAGLDPKKITFRIYRDVRFSKNKAPYKSNMSAGISPRGKMVDEPGVYVHIQPGNKSFVAAGLWMPQPEPLAKIRQEIDYNGDALKKIMNDKKFKKMSVALLLTFLIFLRNNDGFLYNNSEPSFRIILKIKYINKIFCKHKESSTTFAHIVVGTTESLV